MDNLAPDTQAELSPMAILFDEGREAYRPDPPYTVSQWADNHRRLSSVASSEPGRWRTSRTPYLRAIMDDLSSYSTVERVAVMKGAQIGMSEAGLNFCGYAIHHSPGPMLYVMPTLDMVKKISKTRLDPMISESPALSERIKPARARDSGNTLLGKDFDGGTLLLTGANSASGLRSMPIRYLVLDEVDGYPASADEEGDPVNLAIKRTSTFVRRKIFALSTPTVKEHSRIGKMFREGDQRYYHVPCDACGSMQPIMWSQIKWSDEEPGVAWFQCREPECKHRHDEHRKGALLAAGEWIATADPVRPGVRSYHVSGLYSPWFKWAEAVAEFQDAKGDPALLQTFTNTVLGEEWEDLGGERIDPDSLLSKTEEFTMPPQVVAQTVGIDVQPDRLEAERVGWGKGEESWSLEYRIFPGDPDQLDVWDQLDDWLAERFEHPAFADGMPISAACIDTGGANTQAAYNFVGPREGRRIWGIKGYAGQRPIWPKRPTRSNKGRINLYAIGVDSAKEVITNRLRRAGPQHAGPGACHFPVERDKEYFEQLTAEVKKVRISKGFKIPEWQPIRERNEAFDCRVYAYAALIGMYAAGANLNREAARQAAILEQNGIDLDRNAADEAPQREETDGKTDVEAASNGNEPPRTIKKRKRRRKVISSRYH